MGGWMGHKKQTIAGGFLLGVAMLICGCRDSVDSSTKIPSAPHPIIILDIDTLRADHLSCYGYERDTSPNIDALSRESVLFEWAFGPAPNTLPSQTTILSSLHPTVHGAFSEEDRVPEEVTTLAEVLNDAGFRTAAFTDGGFMSKMFGLSQGFELYDGRRGGLERTGDKILQWVRQHAQENFLLLVHTYDVHAPYDPPEPFKSRYTDGLEAPTPGFEPTIEKLLEVRKSHFTPNPTPLPPNDLAFSVARYDGGIRYVDNWIGIFVDELKTLGLLDRATLVVLSDHGEEFQEHGSVGHEKIYSTVTHIPMIFRFPGGNVRQRIDKVVSAVDVMPTLLDVAGVAPPPSVQGRSLVPLMQGTAQGPYLAFGESNYFGKRRFIAFGDHRLLYTEKKSRSELYHFRRDPHELDNLVEQDAATATRLRDALLSWRQKIEASSPEKAAETNELDPEIRQQLKALGYIE